MTRRSPHRPRTRAAALAVVLTLSVPGTGGAQSSFTSLTFFGDSYSDTGNAYLGSGRLIPPSPPYYMGRFSNGPVWVDYFATLFGRPGDANPTLLAGAASGNYAVGGARTTGGSLDPAAQSPPGTDLQIARYLSRPGATPATLTDPTGLYTLFVGGNDLRDIGNLATPAERAAAATAAAQRVLAEAGALADAGARSVLLFTLASPGIMPEAQGNTAEMAARDQATAVFDAVLNAGIAGLQAARPLTRFFDFRLDALTADLLADARSGGARYGITNVTSPCLPALGFPPPVAACDVSLFADDQHPTTKAHAVIANAVYQYVTTAGSVAAVPEPATIALVGGGLLLLPLARRRRRR